MYFTLVLNQLLNSIINLIAHNKYSYRAYSIIHRRPHNRLINLTQLIELSHISIFKDVKRDV